MPTGYTHAVQTGEITTVEAFAMRCARAFGALVTMRDEPLSAPIPERLEPQTAYHDERIASAQKRLAELDKLSAEDCERLAWEAYAAELKQHNERVRINAEQRARYEAMIAKVEAWSAPETHAALREFMLQQLRDSLRFDCRLDYPAPVVVSAEEWLRREKEKASWELNYHTREREEEIKRTEERNEWLRELRASLTNPPDTP